MTLVRHLKYALNCDDKQHNSCSNQISVLFLLLICLTSLFSPLYHFIGEVLLGLLAVSLLHMHGNSNSSASHWISDITGEAGSCTPDAVPDTNQHTSVWHLTEREGFQTKVRRLVEWDLSTVQMTSHPENMFNTDTNRKEPDSQTNERTLPNWWLRSRWCRKSCRCRLTWAAQFGVVVPAAAAADVGASSPATRALLHWNSLQLSRQRQAQLQSLSTKSQHATCWVRVN